MFSEPDIRSLLIIISDGRLEGDDFDPVVTARKCFQMAFVSLQLLTLSEKYFRFACFINCLVLFLIDGWLRMGLLPPLGNFADISYLVEN